MNVWVQDLTDVSTPGHEPNWWFAGVRVQLAKDGTDPFVGSVEAGLFDGDRHDETLVANVDEDGVCILTGALKNGVREAEARIQQVRIQGATYDVGQNLMDAVTVLRPKKRA